MLFQSLGEELGNDFLYLHYTNESMFPFLRQLQELSLYQKEICYEEYYHVHRDVNHQLTGSTMIYQT